LYVAHFAITDVARGAFKFADQYSRGALGLAGAQAEPFHVWLNDWELGPTLHARGQGYELTLDVGALGEPVLNGDHGLSHKSSEPGAATYYYSIPRIPVRGQLVRDGTSLNVHGLAWLDREWGSGSLGAKEQGWDWFAFQLDDGSALMFYSLRKHDGTRDPNSSGTWIDARGQGHPLGADQVLIDVSDHWISPRGGRYPSLWRVRVPSAGLDVEVHPVLADQELGTRPRYWEGAVDLRGKQSGGDIAGRGYVELVGYDE
jgi:predicted secreted hydrolase